MSLEDMMNKEWRRKQKGWFKDKELEGMTIHGDKHEEKIHRIAEFDRVERRLNEIERLSKEILAELEEIKEFLARFGFKYSRVKDKAGKYDRYIEKTRKRQKRFRERQGE